MVRLPDADAAVALLREIGSPPTAPFHEWRALAAIRARLEAIAIDVLSDDYGQLYARVSRGAAKRSLVLVAHTDHPAFDIVVARGNEGRARVRGGLQPRCFSQPVPVLVYRDGREVPVRGVADDFVLEVDMPNWSPGHVRIAADAELAAGDWAVPDIPPFEQRGDEIHMRAADDLAGCALAIGALAAMADEARPFDLHAVFTRAEEPGLFGARLLAEAGSIPRDAYVVSIEASRALPHAAAGAGIVVRAGDMHNTFSNEAERYLRVAQEQLALADPPIATQRALLTGGTCEASAFVRLGWTATGIALPNVNYHNAGAEDRFVPEVIRLSDFRSGVALLAEAAVAAGEDANESWWPTAQRVPDEIREMLRDGRIDEGATEKGGG